MSEETFNSNQDQFVTVFYAQHEWTAPDNPQLKRWKLIVEDQDGLSWAYTYNPALTKLGTHRVVFYRDTSMRRSVRVPKEGAPHDA